MVAGRSRTRAWQALSAVFCLSLVAPLAGGTHRDESSRAEVVALSGPTWQGWATSVASNGRKIAPIAETSATATVAITVDLGDERPNPWLGTGASLTDAAVSLLASAPDALARLYDPTRADGAHLNLLRLPLTATDLSYPDDLWNFEWSGALSSPPARAVAATDMVLSVKSVRPDLQVVATPWSAPPSMKTNGHLIDGNFVNSRSADYAAMLNSQAAWLQARGVPVEYMTIVNEPAHKDWRYPSTDMSTQDQIDVAGVAGPLLAARGVDLWAHDHNWKGDADNRGGADDARTVVLGAPNKFKAVAYHCYNGGSPSMMSRTSELLPSVMTECTQNTGDNAESSLAWDATNLVRDAIYAGGSRGLFTWSLALDPNGGPKLEGTCTGGQGECMGLLTIQPGGTVVAEEKFYTLAHLSRAADPDSTVLGTVATDPIIAAAFKNDQNEIGVFGVNNSASSKTISVRVLGGGERRFTVGAHEVFTFRGPPGVATPSSPGQILISPNGLRYYLDTTSTRHRHYIASDAVFECNGGWSKAQVVEWDAIDTYPEAETAACFNARAGDIIRHPDGDSYVLSSDGAGLVRSWIPTATDYVCAKAEGRVVVEVTRYQVVEIRSGADRPGGNCIIRGPGGDSHFINNEGRREWIPDSPTWDCEIGRGVPVRDVSAAFVTSVTEVGWHYCLNKANLRNKILRHYDGDAYFIRSNDTKTWIPDGATYACRTRQGVPVVQTRWREYVNAFPGSEWDYCYDINTMKGRIISHPDGDSHYVDTDGVRHWIPSTGVYNCLRARGIPADTIRWRDYITRTPEREWAVCGDTITTNQKLDRGQWLQSSDGRYKLIMQGDGNLVLYNSSGRAIWATNRSGVFAIVQGDGNFVEYSSTAAVWASNTVGKGGNRLIVQSDGNLVLYSPSKAVWATNTVGR